ncbi:MAG: hypothetical protein K8U03_02755 [Planctomycetia bacterium]|nr:hypothetical protein [Planctomycetia bacterium]
MSSPEEDALKRRYKEFLDLMPLTIAIAGLSENTAARSFSTDQMEARAQILTSAFKIARQTARDVLKAANA